MMLCMHAGVRRGTAHRRGTSHDVAGLNSGCCFCCKTCSGRVRKGLPCCPRVAVLLCLRPRRRMQRLNRTCGSNVMLALRRACVRLRRLVRSVRLRSRRYRSAADVVMLRRVPLLLLLRRRRRRRLLLLLLREPSGVGLLLLPQDLLPALGHFRRVLPLVACVLSSVHGGEAHPLAPAPQQTHTHAPRAVCDPSP